MVFVGYYCVLVHGKYEVLQCTYDVILRRTVAEDKEYVYIFCVCVCSLPYLARKAHALYYTVICGFIKL
jgi:hypothetical protein